MEQTNAIRYDIKVFLASDTAAAARPFHRADGSEDVGSICEYEEFVINVFAALDFHEFESDDERTGDEGETAYHITAHRQGESNDPDIECEVHIKVSPSETGGLTRPQSKAKDTWRLQSITINGAAFESYDDAIDSLFDKLIPEALRSFGIQPADKND